MGVIEEGMEFYPSGCGIGSGQGMDIVTVKERKEHFFTDCRFVPFFAAIR
jgi:hypothetical protein